MAERLQRSFLWITVLYFAQGLPFGVFNDAVPVYLRLSGSGLVEIGLMSLLQLPWSLKVFWSPLVDRLGSPRVWIVSALGVLALVHAAMGVMTALPFFLLLLAMASATQDVAIDALFVRLLEPHQHGLGNGIRVTAFRIAMIVGGGLTVMLAGALPWQLIWWLVAGVFALLACVCLAMPSPDKPAQKAEYLTGFWQWLRRPGMLPVFAFVLLYKLADSAMGPMVRPFWVDRGMTPQEIGFVTTTVGMGAAIVGAMLGGLFVQKRGLLSALFWLGLAQAGSNVVYALVAWEDLGRFALYGASVSESLCAGLGTAAFLTLLTRACDPVHAAAQYALLSAVFGFTRTIAGAFSGVFAERLGFAPFFALTALLAIPAFVLLPFVRNFLGELDTRATART